MKIAHIVTWFMLIVLTTTAYLFSEGSLSGPFLVSFIMAITVVKFTAIGWQFIGLNKAHLLWRALFTGFILLYSLLVISFA